VPSRSVKTGTCDADPHEPVFAFTVASVSGRLPADNAPIVASPLIPTAAEFSVPVAEYQRPVPVTLVPAEADHVNVPLVSVRTVVLEPGGAGTDVPRIPITVSAAVVPDPSPPIACDAWLPVGRTPVIQPAPPPRFNGEYVTALTPETWGPFPVTSAPPAG